MDEDSMEISKQTKAMIKQAEADIKAGRVYSFEEIKRRLNRKNDKALP